MRSKLKGRTITLIAETESEQELIREMSRNRLLVTRSSSFGAPPNWMEVEIVAGFDYYDLKSSLRSMLQL